MCVRACACVRVCVCVCVCVYVCVCDIVVPPSFPKSPEIAFQRSNHIVGKATIYDMDVDTAGKLMATAGQDKILR